MTYNEIIKPFLLEFDKLEVGQTLWSVKKGDEKILKIDKSDEYCIYTNLCTYDKNGNYHKEDKYPILFTANPFENLQVIDPKKMWNKPHINIGEIKTEKQPFATYDDLIQENIEAKEKINIIETSQEELERIWNEGIGTGLQDK